MAAKGQGMTDTPLRLELVFDADVTRAALSLPLGAGPRRPAWQKLGLGLLGGGVFGGLAIVVLRLGFGLQDALAYLIAAVLGGWAINAFWQWHRHRFMAQILGLLAALEAQEGVTNATIDTAGVSMRSANASSTLGWPVITAIDAVAGGTALLFGASRLVIPDHCLPADLDGAGFRARLMDWKSAHG